MSIRATTVVHCQRAPFDVYIGRRNPKFPRGSAFGNPFTLRDHGYRALDHFRAWFLDRLTNEEFRAMVLELRGKVLGCWCDDVCHGWIIAAWVDGEPREETP